MGHKKVLSLLCVLSDLATENRRLQFRTSIIIGKKWMGKPASFSPHMTGRIHRYVKKISSSS